MSSNNGSKLWKHISDCLGLGDRKLTYLQVTFAIDDAVIRVKTEEFILNANVPEFIDKQWELKEVDNGDNPTTQVQP